MKIPKIEKHAKLASQTNPSMRRQTSQDYYVCKHCGGEFTAYYGDQKNIRAHLRTKHRQAYYMSVEYIIKEEPDWSWSPAK